MKENPKYAVHKLHSNLSNIVDGEENDHKSHKGDHGEFRFCGKFDFEDSDLAETLKECGWKITHSTTPQQKIFLETTNGYKDYKETVIYSGPQGNAVMHRNYRTDVHKLIINSNTLQNSEDSIKAIKGMFELGLGCTCYDENNLPGWLVQRIKLMRRENLKIKGN